MYQLRGMRISLSPRQWQPWTAVSSSLLISIAQPEEKRFSFESLTAPYVCFSAEAHAVMKSVRSIFVSGAIFVVFTSFTRYTFNLCGQKLIATVPIFHYVHSKPTEAPHGTFFVTKHCLVPAILDMCGFLSSRIPYYANGTSTFRLIKVRLSEDVEENPGPAITGVRGVSGGKIVSFIFPTQPLYYVGKMKVTTFPETSCAY